MHHQNQEFKLKSVLFALSSGLALITIILGIFFFNHRNEQNLNDNYRTSALTETKIKDLLSNLQDAETGQRGYLLTSKESYLVPYNNAIEQNPDILQFLKENLQTNNVSLSDLDEVTRLSKLKLDELALTIEYNKAGRNDLALELVKTDIGKGYMDSIRWVIGSMRAGQEQRLNQSITKMQKIYPLSNGIVIGGLSLLCIILYYMYSVVRPLFNKIEVDQRELLANQSLIHSKNEQLEHFAYITSHDLREPLRTISSFIDVIDKELKDSTNQRIQNSTKFIKQAAERMMNLIQGILSYSHIGSSEKTQQVDINQSIQEITNDLSNLITETNADISYDRLPIIYGKRIEIRLLFQNLLANAIKFRKENSSPIIHISYESDAEYWKFKISDNGIGIAQEHLSKIFRFFTKLHLKTEYDGQGIGLAFCQKIVEGHGGRIEVQSELGQGSTFSFTISKKHHS